MFPITEGPDIPWAMIELHENQEQYNHDQTLERLAKHGGLDVTEAVDVLLGRKWRSTLDTEGSDWARWKLTELVREFVKDDVAHLCEQLARVTQERDDLIQLIDTPHTGEFFESVKREAAHQVKRWGTEHDEGKEPTDWLWLLGHLAGKAVTLPEKRLHHIISSAAVLLNWYRRETGDGAAFQPGIGGLD
ncbi:hypothetical protein LCGC14_3078260 [marine sediment metagenome]|uniref:Uncharacterized protein n=1 Tax=marine sediment metagenome TaxID=412755 RepID=A0A0F8WDZ8_9ZZZZ